MKKSPKTWEWDVSSRISNDTFINGPGGKFIVVRARQGDKEKRIIWATGLCNHVSLLAQCVVCLPDGWDHRTQDVSVEMLGGGEVRADLKTRTYFVWGESPEYGMEPDREQTVADFDRHFVGWSAVGTEPPEGTFDYYTEACRENRARPNPGSRF